MSLTFLRGQAHFMREHGVELSAISSPGPELVAFGDGESVPTVAVPMARRITPLLDLVALARLWAHFRRVRPDIVHAHTPKGGLLGMLAATLARVPVRIYHMRGLPLMGARGARRSLLTATERISCGLAAEVLCVSQSLRAAALELGLDDPDHIRVLAGGSGQGVDAAQRFNPARFDETARLLSRRKLDIPPHALVYGFVGRVVRDKGVHELHTAWQSVRATIAEARLVIVGPWEPLDPISSSVRTSLERDDRVHIVGPTAEVPALYAVMDVLVLPTYREGFPNVPLEAASMELPVIATRVPGCVDAVLDGVTGTLVPARDSAALAEAMLSYRAVERRIEHGLAGRRRALEQFSRELIWQELLETYLRHASRRTRRGRPGSMARNPDTRRWDRRLTSR